MAVEEDGHFNPFQNATRPGANCVNVQVGFEVFPELPTLPSVCPLVTWFRERAIGYPKRIPRLSAPD
jgi:hypothetical protein